ncbi:MAG TPA: TetR/AcrR family transcriptional regulator [Streptosporangiaceae bacterium]
MDQKAPGTSRPGGRTARTRAAVLGALVAELIEHGYAGASVERVAVRAGIAKTTVYRRWGGINGLLADLMSGYAAQEIAVPDEGDLGSDLRVLAAAVVTALSDPAIGAAFASVVAAAVRDPAAREVLSKFVAARAATMSIVVQRAADRGEIPPGTDAAAVIQTVTAQLYYRLFVTGEPLGPAVADRAAGIAAAAARTGVFASVPPGDSPRGAG